MTRRPPSCLLTGVVVGALAVAAVAAWLLLRQGWPATGDTTATTATAVEVEVSGDIGTHDPALVVGQDGAPWYVFSTGTEGFPPGSIQIRSSPDGQVWSDVGPVWQPEDEPAWVGEKVSGVRNYWAPEVVQHDGTYYLYWAASTFGSNTSVIGLHTSPTLDPTDPDYGWTDQGEVVASTGGDDFNAIDPGVVTDADGTPWMAFGSFWSGIRMVELSWPSGLRADLAAEPLRLADRQSPPNAIEAPSIVARDGWYYLFVSLDSCCRGLGSTYKIAVGRSAEVTGPYLDRDGTPLLNGGGTVLLETDGDMVGPGGQSISDGYLAFHYYDRTLDGAYRLAIRRLGWSDGWPVAEVSSG